MSNNGACDCLAANSARRQQIQKHLSKFDIALQNRVEEFLNQSNLCINNHLETMYCAEIIVLLAILLKFCTAIRLKLQLVKPRYIQLSGNISGILDDSNNFFFKICVYRIAGDRCCCYFVADLWLYFIPFCVLSTALFWCAYTARSIYTLHKLLICCGTASVSGQDCGCKQRGQTAMFWLKNALFMPRLGICSRDLHWHQINGPYTATQWRCQCST